MKVGDTVALAIQGHRNVFRGTVTEVHGTILCIEYFLRGSECPRYCKRWERDVILIANSEENE